MAERRIAVVTGGNKGLGFETCRNLALNGITVILTARNERNGTEAVEKLRESGLVDVVFHLLDVKDAASIANLAKFVETKYKKLDILVNNAGESGHIVNVEKLQSMDGGLEVVLDDDYVDFSKGIVIQTYEMTVECLKTNYYGTKEVTEALLPLLQHSESPRIVNVTSYLGLLFYINNGVVKAMLSNVETLTEEKIDDVLQQFLSDFKDDKLKGNGWPLLAAAYKVSKAGVNAYTKLMAKRYPKILINCVHPGHVQTDMTYGTGQLTLEEGVRGLVMVALLPDDGPSGRFFNEMQEHDY